MRSLTRYSRNLTAATSVLLGALTLSAGAHAYPTVTFSSDRGTIQAAGVAQCSRPKPPPEPPPPGTGMPGTICGDRFTVLGSPNLGLTRGTPVLVRFSVATTDTGVTLLDQNGTPFTDVSGEVLDAQSFRFVVPPTAPASVYASVETNWEGESYTGRTTYAVQLTSVDPPPAVSEVALLALSRASKRKARLTLSASRAGVLALTWRGAGRKGTVTANVKAGSQVLVIRTPRQAKRLSISATLLAQAGSAADSTKRRFRLRE